MNSFLNFTLAAGVAISSTSVVYAAGSSRGTPTGDRAASAAQRQTPAGTTFGNGLTLDTVAFNRELGRLSELLNPVGAEDDLVSDGHSVAKKVGGTWTY